MLKIVCRDCVLPSQPNNCNKICVCGWFFGHTSFFYAHYCIVGYLNETFCHCCSVGYLNETFCYCCIVDYLNETFFWLANLFVYSLISLPWKSTSCTFGRDMSTCWLPCLMWTDPTQPPCSCRSTSSSPSPVSRNCWNCSSASSLTRFHCWASESTFYNIVL